MTKKSKKKAGRKRSPKDKGDCLRRSVASLLDKPVHRVPDFVNKYKGRWKYYLVRWVQRRGYLFIEGRSPGILGAGVKRWINVGTTRYGRAHAVCREGERVLYDGGTPLRTVKYFIVILKRAA